MRRIKRTKKKPTTSDRKRERSELAFNVPRKPQRKEGDRAVLERREREKRASEGESPTRDKTTPRPDRTNNEQEERLKLTKLIKEFTVRYR